MTVESKVAVKRPPPIDELVGLLDRYDPSHLKELQKKYPGKAYLLKPGIIAGTETGAELQLRTDTCVAGLTAAIPVCDQMTVKIREQLKRGRLFQFLGQLTTAVAGASIFTTIAGSFPASAKYAAGGLALIGSLLTLISQYLAGTLGGTGNMLDLYKELVDNGVDAKQLLSEIKLLVQLDGYSRLSEIISQANALCAKLNRTILKL